MVAKSNRLLQHLTQSDNFTERRKTARLDIPIKVLYKIVGNSKKVKEAVTKDVSVGGCLLLLQEKVKVGSDVELEIFLGDNETESLKLKGEIVRLDRSDAKLHQYGISFAEMGKEARRLFADFCFAKMYEMIGLSEWPTAQSKK